MELYADLRFYFCVEISEGFYKGEYILRGHLERLIEALDKTLVKYPSGGRVNYKVRGMVFTGNNDYNFRWRLTRYEGNFGGGKDALEDNASKVIQDSVSNP